MQKVLFKIFKIEFLCDHCYNYYLHTIYIYIYILRNKL